MSSNHPSDDPCGEQLTEDDLSKLRATARRLLDAIAAEPVPDRLRELALELGKALDRQQGAEAADEASRPR